MFSSIESTSRNSKPPKPYNPEITNLIFIKCKNQHSAFIEACSQIKPNSSPYKNHCVCKCLVNFSSQYASVSIT